MPEMICFNFDFYNTAKEHQQCVIEGTTTGLRICVGGLKGNKNPAETAELERAFENIERS